MTIQPERASLCFSGASTHLKPLKKFLVLLPFSLGLLAACATATGDETEERVVDEADEPAAPEQEETASSEPTSEVSMGGSSAEEEPAEVQAFLPMTVTEYFGPSGFMGREGMLDEVDGIVMDPEGCDERAEDAAGECFQVSYTPQELAEDGGTWAGVYFQNPESNWGEEPGVVVEPGASRIVFTAWAESDGLDVEFFAGGIGNLGTAYSDSFRVGETVTLSTTPTQYELDLSNATYQHVLGGFGWVLAADSLDPVVFFLDDIRWVK